MLYLFPCPDANRGLFPGIGGGVGPWSETLVVPLEGRFVLEACVNGCRNGGEALSKNELNVEELLFRCDTGLSAELTLLDDVLSEGTSTAATLTDALERRRIEKSFMNEGIAKREASQLGLLLPCQPISFVLHSGWLERLWRGNGVRGCCCCCDQRPRGSSIYQAQYQARGV